MSSCPFTVSWEPLRQWPRPDTKPRRSPQFKASYDDTLSMLNDELDAIGVKGAVAIQVVTRGGEADLRRDGNLRAAATVVHPGVQVSFTSKFGPTTIGTDAFSSPYANRLADWQHNLRALVLGLNALRSLTRYGIGQSGEAYRGWQQLASTGSAGMSREVALAVLGEEADMELDEVLHALDSPDGCQTMVKHAQRRAHPDVNKGDATRWGALAQALEALELS